MHTLHYWLVEAEDKEDSRAIVTDRLISEEGDKFVGWSDWHVVGGGRWSDSQYEDSSDMIVSYTEKPALFDSIIEDIKKARVKEMQDCMSKINTDKFISNMVDYISNNASLGDMRFDMNTYYIKSASDLMDEHYTSGSYFYDLIEYTANMNYIQDHIDKKNPAMLFLVPIDFHY
jgi:hypothetical protein